MALARLRRDIVRVWRKLSGAKARARAAAFAEFDAALRALRPDDLAIDLGATGAQVIAFEPDPHALALLAASTATCDNVRRVQAAAGAQAGVFQLYRHADFDTAPDRHTTSSSLIADKRNVSAASAVDVEVVDFIAYLVALNRDVALLKIDIEGAEVERSGTPASPSRGTAHRQDFRGNPRTGPAAFGPADRRPQSPRGFGTKAIHQLGLALK